MSQDRTLARFSGHPGIDRWNDLLNELAPQYDVPPNLAKAHILYESGGDPNIIGGSGRGLGLMQIDYGTNQVVTSAGATIWIYDGPNGRCATPFDPRDNILIGCRDFIKENLSAFPDDLNAAIAAYNAGIEAVQKALAEGLTLVAPIVTDSLYVPHVREAYEWLCS